MKENRVKRATPAAMGKAKPATDSSSELRVNEVIENLFDLFKRLGLRIPLRVPRVADNSMARRLSPALYPYASPISELLTWWHQDPAYLDNLGNPAPLKLRGRRPSFRSLVHRAVPKMDMSELLAELVRVGAVTVDENGFIHVHMRSISAYEDKRLALEHTLTSLNGFIQTLRHNLNSVPSNSDQFFHRIAWNNEFDSREIPALKIRVKRHGQSFLESFDNWLARKSVSKTRGRYPRTRHAKVSIGVYLSVEKD